MLWSRGIARQRLMGAERTHNPSPAAASMIGKARVARASKVYYATRVSRPHYKGNPVPALLLGLAPKLGLTGLIGGGPDAAKQKLRIAKLDDYAYQVVNTKGAAGQEALMHLQAISQRQEGHGVAINDAIVTHARELVDAIRKAATPPAKSPQEKILAAATSPAGIQAIAAAAASAGRPTAGQKYNKYGQLTQRVFQGYNPLTGKPKYKQVVVGAAGAGASLLPGVGGGAAAAGGIGAGGVLLAGAAGVAAYFATQAVLRHFGGKKVSAQRQGVEASIAHREALEGFAAHVGRAPTVAEKNQINDAWRQQLAELGYNPETMTRDASLLDRLTGGYFSED